ncbi:nucleomorphin-like [Bradysia coprophila]|uniref:nucleomorphin-like n=1 Tax=Bradysia coprophila TaxID=38358 RepID=UPI00187D7C3F|nr:nucleomorphin-like [Bradysia coprophila]
MDDLIKFYRLLKEDFLRATKRILKEEVPKQETTLEDARIDIITTFNKIVQFYIDHWNKFSEKDQDTLLEKFETNKNKLIDCFKVLNVIADPNTITYNQLLVESELKRQINSNPNSRSDPNQTNESGPDYSHKMSAEENFLKLCGSTINKPYDGDPLSLNSFVDSLNLLNKMAKSDALKEILIEFALTKLIGTVRDGIVGTPGTVNEIIDAVKAVVKPESSKVVEGKFHALRLDRTPVQNFCDKSNELAERFRRALILEGIPPERAEIMTVDKTVEVCRLNAKSDLIKSVLASTPFTDHKEVVSKFICEISSQRQEKQVLSYRAQRGNPNNYRGRGRNRGNGYSRGNNRGDQVNSQTFYNSNRNDNSNNNYYRRNNRYNGRSRGTSNRGYRSNNFNNSSYPVRYLGNEEAPQWGLGGESQEIVPQRLAITN